MSARVKNILNQCKKLLQEHYKKNFKGLVVYGSVARNEEKPDSDIDLLVLMSQPFDFFKELRTIIDLLYPVQLSSKRLISAKPADDEEYQKGTIQLYRNAKQEGLDV